MRPRRSLQSPTPTAMSISWPWALRCLRARPLYRNLIYYAKNISAAAASANAVTVKFNASAYLFGRCGSWNMLALIRSVRWT